MFSFRKTFGKKGEDTACCFLENNGYQIIQKNYRTRFGEIDIIARDKSTIVFIEVKSRKHLDKFGSPKLAVDSRKRLQIIKTALSYISYKNLKNTDFRFDVVTIVKKEDGINGNGTDDIELITNAFDADGF